MARNRIQFQKGLSEARFAGLYGTEELCRAAVARWRWPDGFVCPKCGGGEHCIVGPRRLYQCNACRRQTSLTAGTLFASTKVPLTTWLRAMYLITQTKQGISSIELGRRLGVMQTTAWKIKTKLVEAMRLVSDSERLDGRVEMDDAYLGGERSGGKTGRGSPGKKPIVVAVETDEKGRPRRIKLRRIARFKRRRVKSLAKRIVAPGATVVTDGLACFRGVADAGCVHVPIGAGSGRRAARHPAFRWVNTMLGNIKSAITGTYRAIRKKHMVRYLAEFEWRFNHRFDLAAMIPALGCAALATRPQPYWWLKMADYGA
ncbi:MAG: IS1595 family transposase [Hyphomicrobium sp.]|uniref:IS1595 family transposase n=1 Tax=Hyphomicrobium sp. TaxID=82 RepID=UPI0025BEDEFC|nr:IS1595 family transposase [Hyphomicrobium sp.]MBZ0210508.1 IS1595 family transposase [Hyphomicrobium sp.]